MAFLTKIMPGSVLLSDSYSTLNCKEKVTGGDFATFRKSKEGINNFV